MWHVAKGQHVTPTVSQRLRRLWRPSLFRVVFVHSWFSQDLTCREIEWQRCYSAKWCSELRLNVLLLHSAEGDVYTWGKGARGRLGRKEEDSGIPKTVQLDESHPFTVTSVACCHGNTLLAVKRNVQLKLLLQMLAESRLYLLKLSIVDLALERLLSLFSL